ncbi:MAG: N-acetyltransferase [Candidatus Marinimicrobia bacterium]|nr:N-acetyltransferase [Candidatus Neomarinimicrobiota bacterium]MCH7764902.1 N-acetyltransferase [Candidatus Neomarinimicrobiota bacterium]
MKKKIFRLKNKSTIIIRDLTSKDVKKLYDFFTAIPESKRRFFRSDVTSMKHLKNRAEQSETGKIIRRIALIDNEIVGDTSLEIDTDSWKSGIAYLRLVIDPNHSGKGVQYVLAKDMYDIAYNKQIEKIYAKFMRPQKDLMDIYTNLGFKMEGVLPDYVHDLKGKEQDMVIMVASIEDFRSAYSFIGDWLDNEHSSVGAGEI